MAYQNIPAPAQVLSREIALTRAFFRHVGDFFSALGNAMMNNSAAQRRFEQVQQLQAKSDEELAVLKIKRDEIVHHVFRDLYYC